jgi:DNA-binding transcriptional MerR regulator
MMQVTVKTLRYYEQKGLLLPYEVDEWTGYRYYSIYQMQRLNIIRGLQQQGFTLEEIKELLEDGEQMPSIDQLTQKIEETEHQLQLLIKRRSQLLKWLDSHKQIKTMEKVNIQSLPEIIVASHREIFPNYDALGALCVNKIGPEMQLDASVLLLDTVLKIIYKKHKTIKKHCNFALLWSLNVKNFR